MTVTDATAVGFVPKRSVWCSAAPSARFVAAALLWIASAYACNAAGDGPELRERLEIFERPNLVAWCIVPFDEKRRGPEERAAMLERLGVRKLAYDYRAEHVPTFSQELDALARHNIELTAWWFPTTLNDEAKGILDLLERRGLKTDLWVTGAGGPASDSDEAAWVVAEAARIRPIAEAAQRIGCRVGLYNHGGWFGEPENQIKIIEQLDLPNVGIVYNLHHGHAHLDRLPEVLKLMLPHLYCLNLNGMNDDGERLGQKILPLGAGQRDLTVLQAIVDSGYRGPIGILNHTDHDAETRLLDNLAGLEWLLPQLAGESAEPRPAYRTWQPPASESNEICGPNIGNATSTNGAAPPYDKTIADELAAAATRDGVAKRGVAVFASAKFACVSCHRIGEQGGTVGPELTNIGKQRTAAQIVESILWPQREVAAEFNAVAILTTDGQLHRGYKRPAAAGNRAILDPASGDTLEFAEEEVDAEEATGSLMPNGLAAAMSRQELLDVVRLLSELGLPEGLSVEQLDYALRHAHSPAEFTSDRAPLFPADWPHWQCEVNRDRLYDFYAKEAEHFRRLPFRPPLLPEFPGLDGGQFGHWGNQKEESWADDRHNESDLGSVQCGVFRGAGVEVARGVCVRLGDHGELAACFNPDTLSYDAVWTGGFVKFSPVRHGFVNGLMLDGTPQSAPQSMRPEGAMTYRGFYRHGNRVVFAYRIGETDYLDAPWAENGQFTRVVAPVEEHPLRSLVAGGPAQWPQTIATAVRTGAARPYAVDTVELPVDNPWRALLYIGDHDFLPNGDALVCTMQGDVWRVEGLAATNGGKAGEPSQTVHWRRIASGLHHALGLRVCDDGLFVLGRDQITRLHDLNDDGEIDYYECFSKAYETSPAGHDFVCGLERDAAGSFYTASGNQGLLRISPDGKRAEPLATGFRNPDGLCVLPDGVITIPCSEGDWTPASMVCAVRPKGDKRPLHFGYGGPRDGQPPELPLVYLPRGLDNSSGAQTYVSSGCWGPLEGKLLHFSYGAGSHFLVLRDESRGVMQGAVVPLAGEFLSGAHRGRFNPADGQLYVSGMDGWGTYTSDDGCLHRVRYTGDRVQLPTAFHVHENGVAVTFAEAVELAIAREAGNHFAQCWNYRYSAAYGSAEYSSSHPSVRGHDALPIASVHVVNDGRTLFLELPELQPVNQLHLRLQVDSGRAHDLFLTVHALDEPFREFSGYRPTAKTIAAHPLLTDLAMATKSVPNPWRAPIEGARPIVVETGKNLTFATPRLTVRAGEAVQFTLRNPDVVPHNWALIRPEALTRVGELANRLVADPEAVVRHYVPDSEDVLVYTDVTAPQSETTIFFRAPEEPGMYPFLCTFPGHWMVMNGVLKVE